MDRSIHLLCSTEVKGVSSSDQSYTVAATFGDYGKMDWSLLPKCCDLYRIYESVMDMRYLRESSGQEAAISIPDSVVELSEECFHGCMLLRSVTFGPSSKLERICYEAFFGRELSRCLFRTVLLNWLNSAFMIARVSEV